MTSQVAVYNMNGIAVASDTVVTSFSDAGSKTTGNAEKIYDIGPDHKVLVLHYGGTRLNDLSHQFHFAEWTQSVSKPLRTLTDYIDSYVSWSNNKTFHSKESEKAEMVNLLYDHFKEVRSRMEHFYSTWERSEGMSDEQAIQALEEGNERLMAEGLEHLKSLEIFEGMSEVKAKEAIKAAEIDLNQITESYFDEFHLNSKFKSLAKSSAPYVLAREQNVPWDSYLAFVGYGTDDPFPVIQVMTCRSIYAGQLVHHKGEKLGLTPGGIDGDIHRFAQSNAIEAFIHGYNTDIMNGVSWAIQKNLRNTDAIPEDSSIPESVANAVVEYIESHSWKRYIQPILRQVSSMNLFGIAELAKTLVSIQATFSEAQDGPVSVGGMIEVATIDRVNGVRWKNRLPR